MAQVKITVRNNGPFRVEAPEGSVELVDADGNAYDLTGKPAYDEPTFREPGPIFHDHSAEQLGARSQFAWQSRSHSKAPD